MNNVDSEAVVGVVRFRGEIRWFRCKRDWWVLDPNKWRDELVHRGYTVPEFNDSFRFGLVVVDETNAATFLEKISDFEVTPDSLAMELAQRFQTARSWWDVGDLFPIAFVDFDSREVGAFYHQGVALERYLPAGWTGRFIDFATEYSEEAFPTTSKFWVKGDVDLLELLNQRARSGS